MIIGWWSASPPKNMSSSVGMTIPTIYGKIKFMFQTTNQIMVELSDFSVFHVFFPEGKVDICWFQLLIFLKMPEQEKKAYKTRTARQDCMLIWICLAGGK